MQLRNNKIVQVSDRNIELIEAFNSQPYSIELDGFNLVIDKDVFPPDIGYASKFLAQVLKKYKPEVALDMGSGSGYLAFVLRKIGVPFVTAIDNHPPAIDCIYKNIKKNPEVMPIRVLKGDLFEPLDEEKIFDLIVFNHPYYPYTNNHIFGLEKDGGKTIIERFLSLAPIYLKNNGVILMPFSDMAGEENNPKTIALSFGYNTSRTWTKSDREQSHYVFEIKITKS